MASSRQPRALITTSTFPRWEGDSTARFVRDLGELAAPQWSVTVLAPHHPGARSAETLGPLDIQRFAYWVPRSQQRLCYEGGILPNARSSVLAAAQLPAFLLAELAATRACLRADGYALVHAHFLVPQGWVAARLLRSRAVPLVVSVHGSDLFALGGPLARAAQRAVLARADVVTVNSDATARALDARVPGARARTILLPMGYDPAVFFGAPRPPLGSPDVLFVGRLTLQKGADVLLDAFPALLARVPAATLTVVGDGPELARLRTQAIALGIAPRVAWRRALARESVAALYGSSAVTVVPSRADAAGSEGQGLVAIEAMACGCPVVASRSGGLGSLLGDDARGLLVPPGEAGALAAAIVATLTDASAAQRRAEAARAHVRACFTWPSLKPRLLEIYAEAVARRRARC